MRTSVLLVCLLACSNSKAPNVDPNAPAGSVVQVEGAVTAKRAADAEPRTLASKAHVFSDDVITTGPAASVRIKLHHNGAVVAIDEKQTQLLRTMAAWNAKPNRGGGSARPADETAVAGRHAERAAADTAATAAAAASTTTTGKRAAAETAAIAAAAAATAAGKRAADLPSDEEGSAGQGDPPRDPTRDTGGAGGTDEPTADGKPTKGGQRPSKPSDRPAPRIKIRAAVDKTLVVGQHAVLLAIREHFRSATGKRGVAKCIEKHGPGGVTLTAKLSATGRVITTKASGSKPAQLGTCVAALLQSLRAPAGKAGLYKFTLHLGAPK